MPGLQGVCVCPAECPVFEISVQVELVVVSLGSKNLRCLVPAVLSCCRFRRITAHNPVPVSSHGKGHAGLGKSVSSLPCPGDHALSKGKTVNQSDAISVVCVCVCVCVVSVYMHDMIPYFHMCI